MSGWGAASCQLSSRSSRASEGPHLHTPLEADTGEAAKGQAHVVLTNRSKPPPSRGPPTKSYPYPRKSHSSKCAHVAAGCRLPRPLRHSNSDSVKPLFPRGRPHPPLSVCHLPWLLSAGQVAACSSATWSPDASAPPPLPQMAARPVADAAARVSSDPRPRAELPRLPRPPRGG